MTPAEIAARHHPGAVINRIGPHFGKQQCDYCIRPWPCDAATLAVEVERLRKALAKCQKAMGGAGRCRAGRTER